MSQAATATRIPDRRKRCRSIPVTHEQFEAIEELQDRTPGPWTRANTAWMDGLREILGPRADKYKMSNLTIEVE